MVWPTGQRQLTPMVIPCEFRCGVVLRTAESLNRSRSRLLYGSRMPEV